MKCENRSRTTCSRFHRLHSESTLACGGGLWCNTCGTCRPQPPSHTLTKHANTRVWGWAVGQYALPVLPTAPFPHAVKRKNAFADTAPAESPRSPQHSAPGIVGTSTRAVARAFASEPQTPKSPQQSASGSAALAHPQSVARFVSTSTAGNHLDHVNDLLVDPWYRNIHDLRLLHSDRFGPHFSHSCQEGTTPSFSVPIRGTDVVRCTVASGS